MRVLELRIPPPLVALATGLLMWYLPRLLPQWQLDLPGREGLALLLAGVGGLIALFGIVAFVLARTTINPHKPAATSALVVGGVYRFTRNPMYLGILFVLLGWAVFLANAAAFLPLPLFVLYLNRFQIAPEERALAAAFGEQFAAYRAKVRRWL